MRSSYRPAVAAGLLATLAVSLLIVGDGPAQERSPAKTATSPPTAPKPYEPPIAGASDEAAKAIGRFQLAPGLKCELWAAEPMLANPVAFTFDEKGRCYVCETFRQQHGVVDNRDHMSWLDDDLAARTVEDRLAYFQKHLKEKLADYAIHHDRIRLLEDTKGAGRADKSTVFADGFNGVLDGTGAGVLVRDGDVYYTCIPDLWRLRDKNNDGVASKDTPGERTSLHHGYGVHVAFRGHDLHGLAWGPDGKLYFTCGDRGLNVKSKDAAGKEYAVTLPDTGAVLRCNPDGSELEVFATGLRNPQELAFDEYGNLFTCDNNSDSGDKARWVYVVEGGNSGWLMSYQYLPDRGPWNREKLWHPQHEGQPAYIIPPVANIADGPSGLAYYPGTGLSEKYNGTFLLCDFRGGPANSGVRTVKLKPKGAGFEIAKTGKFIWGILATDVDFGPDGAVYVSDWVDGWNGTGKGRIYRISSSASLDGTQAAQSRDLGEAEVQAQLNQRRESLDGGLDSRLEWLAHPDRRVRLTTQRFLSERYFWPSELASFIEAPIDPTTGRRRPVSQHADWPRILRPRQDLARLHAVWWLGQWGRRAPITRDFIARWLAGFLNESKDAELRAQCAKVLGEIGPGKTYGPLIHALEDESPRVRFFAAISLGKLRRAQAIPWLLQMLAANADKDPYLRHAGVMGLAGIGNAEAMLKIADQPSPAARMGILLALRRLKHPGIARFLHDAEPALVTETARAIHDELIEPALPELAKLTAQVGLPDAAIHRALNANFRLGVAENAEAVAALGAAPRASEAMRVEAIEMLAAWAKPSGRDRVLGLWRPLVGRTSNPSEKSEEPSEKPPIGRIGNPSYEAIAIAAAKKHLPGFFAGPSKVRQAAAKLATALKLGDAGPMLFAMAVDAKSPQQARLDALAALTQLKDPKLADAIKQTLNDPDAEVRAAAQRALAAHDPPAAVDVLRKVLGSGTRAERQSAFASLGQMKLPAADAILTASLDQLLAGKVAAEVQLDLLLAAESRAKADRKAVDLKERLDKFNAARPKSDPLAVWRETLEGGNAERGRAVFFDRVDLSCRRCHKIGDSGGNVGPELTHIAKDKTREYLLESIVLPDKILAQGFQAAMVQTDDGRTHSGIVKSEDDKVLTLQTAEGNFVTIPKATIEQRGRGRSPMPEDVIKQLNKSDLRDLVEYLSTLK